ncbi:FAD-dependent oxidoreductase [Chitinimonas lacunae]|uniref:FAD-dependent oxidoreductase n=1 Tax=Chitinimonas lacunae TaxID=1963018 RepID=A0ABV8MTB5_9NEIS
MEQTEYDVIVIGAGVGGSNVALELARAGWRVLVLEAGRYYSRRSYPRGELDGNAQLFWNGGMELNRSATLALLRAKVVGGGSIVNQALLDEFDHDALDDWRQLTGMDLFSETGMRPWYERARAALQIQTVPLAHANRNARLFADGFARCGFQCAPLERGEADCGHGDGNDCIECLYGCRRDSKQSTPMTSLKGALEAGAQLLPECEVLGIEEVGQGVRVHGRLAGGRRLLWQTRSVVLAAGAVGSTGLLLRSGYAERLPRLGQRFFSHPQYMYYARYREPVDAHRGPLQSYKSADAGFRRQGFKLENVFAPPVGTALLLPGSGAPHQQRMRQLRHFACIEVAVRDTAPGRIGLDRHGRPLIDKELDSEDRRRAAAGRRAVEAIFEATGAEAVLPGRFGICLHLMGGLTLGRNAATAVVGADFRLFGSPHVYVADAGLFPSAPGINPSLTIMALGRRVAARMLEDRP